MEQDNPVLDAIRGRRSIRRYSSGAVRQRDLLAVLEAGRWAPTGRNNQPQRFLVLKAGDPRIEALAGCTRYGGIVRSADRFPPEHFLFEPLTRD